MSINPVQVSQVLLSSNQEARNAVINRLGATKPHQELVAISSTLIIDSEKQQPLFTVQQVKRMINAAYSHLSMLPTLTKTAQEDVINKSWDVKHCAIKWATHHAPTQLVEHIEMLRDELRSLLEA
jgi:hypothetical protein